MRASFSSSNSNVPSSRKWRKVTRTPGCEEKISILISIHHCGFTAEEKFSGTKFVE